MFPSKRAPLNSTNAMNFFLLMVLPLAGFICYAGTMFYPPIWDDTTAALQQPFLSQCSDFWTLLHPRYLFWVLPVTNSARPAWLASVLCDRCLFGDAFAGYRLSSMAWHAAGAVFVAGIAWRWTRSRSASWISGLLFLTHPLHTEAVNIISFRTDLMALDFMALSLLLYWESKISKSLRSQLFLMASLGMFAMALLSKEMAVTLPLLLILSDWLDPNDAASNKPKPSRGRAYASYAALLLVYVLFHISRSGYAMGSYQDAFSVWKKKVPWMETRIAPEFESTFKQETDVPDPLPWQEVYERKIVRLATMSDILGSSLRLLVWPHPLQGDYAPTPLRTLFDSRVFLSWILWSAWFAAAWALRRRRPAVSFGMLWIPITLLPVSGIIGIRNLRADRYLYTPSAGLCIALGAVMTAAARALQDARPSLRRLNALPSLCGFMLCAAYGLATMIRNKDYRDNETFYKASLRNDPEIPQVRINLGKIYEESGRWPEAEAQYRYALRLWPSMTQGRILLAGALSAHDRRSTLAPKESRLTQGIQRATPR